MKWIIAFGIIVAGVVLEGLVLNILWDWFVVPLGVAEISVSHAIGLSCLIGLLTQGRRTAEEAPSAALRSSLAFLFTRPLFALAIGYIAYVSGGA